MLITLLLHPPTNNTQATSRATRLRSEKFEKNVTKRGNVPVGKAAVRFACCGLGEGGSEARGVSRGGSVVRALPQCPFTHYQLFSMFVIAFSFAPRRWLLCVSCRCRSSPNPPPALLRMSRLHLHHTHPYTLYLLAVMPFPFLLPRTLN